MNTNLEKVRTWLALLLVGGFSIVTFLTVILVTIGYLRWNDGIEVLKSFSSVYSGFVGIVLGYYFAKAEKPSVTDKQG
jgi:hypothetical protein